MKILSYIVEDGMIKVTTDNKDRPEFVYPQDKFKNKSELDAEINKSIASEKKRKDKAEINLIQLEGELNATN